MRGKTEHAIAATAAVLLLLCLPAIASAGWKQVTTSDGAATEQAAGLRTGDGTLHVVWQRPAPGGAGGEELLHRPIGANGSLGNTTVIVSGWDSIEDPALVSSVGLLRVVFGGVRSGEPGEQLTEFATATSSNGGGSWTLQETPASGGGASAGSSEVAASISSSGTVYKAWAASSGTYVHAGLTPGGVNHDFQAPIGPRGFDPGIATSRDDVTFLAWYSSAPADRGVLAHQVAGNGSPQGAVLRMPGTEGMSAGTGARTPIVTVGSDFYVGYPSGPGLSEIRVWKVGQGSSMRLAGTKGSASDAVALAATPDGRLWVAWAEDRKGTPRVYAMRSDPGVTKFGARVDGGKLKRSGNLSSLGAEVGPGGSIDLLGTFSLGTGPAYSTFHNRLLPGIDVKAKAKKLSRGKGSKAVFKLRDAGQKLGSAQVKIGRDRYGANAKGKVVARLAKKRGKIKAKVTAPGYEKAKVKLKIKR